jgi:hypothetical protein
MKLDIPEKEIHNYGDGVYITGNAETAVEFMKSKGFTEFGLIIMTEKSVDLMQLVESFLSANMHQFPNALSVAKNPEKTTNNGKDLVEK